MIVIAMNGLIGSGKSTASEILVRKFGFREMKFACWLKTMMRSLGLTEQEIEGSLKETPNPLLCGKSPRHAMQTLGTEWGRKMIGDDFWVNFAVQEAKHSSLRRIVFSDCRYPNEAAAIREQLGGQVWKLFRPQCLAGSHSSERDQEQVQPDLLIDNSGTLEDLEERISFAVLRLVHDGVAVR